MQAFPVAQNNFYSFFSEPRSNQGLQGLFSSFTYAFIHSFVQALTLCSNQDSCPVNCPSPQVVIASACTMHSLPLHPESLSEALKAG